MVSNQKTEASLLKEDKTSLLSKISTLEEQLEELNQELDRVRWWWW